jgi:ATP-binding cassette subfamily F protein uup
LNYLTLENITKSFGEKILFENINLTIAKGQKIALIAKNGTGKTTLLRVIAGTESVEGELAKVIVSKDIVTRYLKQEPYFNDDDTVLEASLDSDNKKIQAIKQLQIANLMDDDDKIQEAIGQVEDLKAWDIESRVKEILGKLNIHRLDQKIHELSGGQKKRLALAKILIEEPDFLILDEPTNHLDIDMIEWLETYLTAKGLTLFMVTHDRYFLERVCNEIVELDDGNLHVYRGNYSDYLEKKDARILNEKSNLEKTKKLYKKELEWMRRSPQARTTKAKSRIDKFYDIKEKAHKHMSDDEMIMNIDMARLGGKILEAHNISKSYDDLKLIEGFSYKFKKGERVGVAGPNGAGKTTLIKILTKEIAPSSGKVVIGDTVVFGHYHQDNESLNEDQRVIDCIREIAEYIPLKKGRKMTAESLLEKFLFPRSQQQVYVKKLSGGEKRRLHLLRILITNPNFLILDEPTNDLDILTINVLEDFLQSYEGCVMVTSHDRFFMDKLVDHMFILEGGGNVKDFNGSYSDYRESKKKEQNVVTTTEVAEEIIEEKTVATGKRVLDNREKKEFFNLESDIPKLEKKKKTLEEKFYDTSLSQDQINDLSKELSDLEALIEEKENRWLELSEFAE